MFDRRTSRQPWCVSFSLCFIIWIVVLRKWYWDMYHWMGKFFFVWCYSTNPMDPNNQSMYHWIWGSFFILFGVLPWFYMEYQCLHHLPSPRNPSAWCVPGSCVGTSPRRGEGRHEVWPTRPICRCKGEPTCVRVPEQSPQRNRWGWLTMVNDG